MLKFRYTIKAVAASITAGAMYLQMIFHTLLSTIFPNIFRIFSCLPAFASSTNSSQMVYASMMQISRISTLTAYSLDSMSFLQIVLSSLPVRESSTQGPKNMIIRHDA